MTYKDRLNSILLAKVGTLARSQKWKMDQLQYGEDYFRALVSSGGRAGITRGLEPKKAAQIKRLYTTELAKIKKK